MLFSGQFEKIAATCLLNAIVNMTKLTVNLFTSIFFLYMLLDSTLAQEAIFTETLEQCKSSSSVDMGLLAAAFSGNGEFPDDPALRSYLHCVFVGLGLQDPDGTVHYDRIRLEPHDLFSFVKHIEDPHAKLNKCESMNPQGATPDETLHLAFKCFMD